MEVLPFCTIWITSDESLALTLEVILPCRRYDTILLPDDQELAAKNQWLKTLIHRPHLHRLFTRNRKARFSGSIAQDSGAQVIGDRRTMLESVAGAAAGNPDIVKIRMAVNQKVAVGSVFILADTGLQDRSIVHCRKMFFQEAAKVVDRGGLNYAAAAIGIEGRAVTVKSDLEAAVFDVGKGIRDIGMAMMQPHGHLR